MTKEYIYPPLKKDEPLDLRTADQKVADELEDLRSRVALLERVMGVYRFTIVGDTGELGEGSLCLGMTTREEIPKGGVMPCRTLD